MRTADQPVLSAGVPSTEFQIAPPFHRVYGRMSLFGIPAIEVENTFLQLLGWLGELAAEGISLRPPAVFCNEHDRIEFEWENGDRSLIATALPRGQYEVSRISPSGDTTSMLTTAQVGGELKWLLG